MSTLRSARRFIRESAATLITIARDVIGSSLQRASVKGAGNSVRAVGAPVNQRLEMHSGNRAIFFHARFKFHQDGMPATMAIEDFFTRETNFDGPIEHEGGLGHDDFVIERIAFPTETTAVGRGNHANMRGRHFQHFSQSPM